MQIDLIPYPATNTISISYSIVQNLITVTISGDIDSVDYSGSQTEKLWQGTCFELFYRNQSESAYNELNFSPDGRVTLSELSAYRTITKTRSIVYKINVLRSESTVVYLIDLDTLELADKEIAVAAITLENGNRRFWGINHWDNPPDFHREENFFHWDGN